MAAKPIQSYRFLQIEQIEKNIRLIRINRPAVMNALTIETTLEIQSAVRDLDRSKQKVGILTGTPPAFSAGGDLNEVLEVTKKGGKEAVGYVYRGFQGMVRAVREVSAVVIAAVNGVAAGGGMDLALSCDLCYASPAARFSQSWVRLGLVPAMGGAYFVQRRAGWRGMRLVFTGEMIGGEEAHSMGLVEGLVADSDLLSHVSGLARKMAAGEGDALASLKWLVHEQEKKGLEKYLADAVRVQGRLLLSETFRRAAEAILRKDAKS